MNQLRVFSSVILLVTLILTPLILNIQYRSEITDYFRSDNPRVINFHELENDLGFQQSLLVLLKLDNDDFLSNVNLLKLFELIQSVRELNGIERVNSVLSLAINDSSENTVSLYNYIKRGGIINDSILGQVADAIASNSGLLSKDYSAANLHVYFSDNETVDVLYPTLQTLIETHSKHLNTEQAFLLGPVEIKHALHQALLHDSVYLMPLVLFVGLGILWYFLRSYWLVVSGAASIVIALWLTAGIVGALKMSINQTSALAFCIAFIIALADIIHLLMSFNHESSEIPETTAMINALKKNGISLFLTSLTTGIGFLSLNWSSSPVFATFGNIAAIGVACAFISAITITPTVAVMRRNYSRHEESDLFQRLAQAINQWRSNMGRSTILGFYGVSIGLSLLVFTNHYHNDPLDYFKSDSAIALSTKQSEKDFGIHHPINIRLESGIKDGIFQRNFLNTLNAFELWLSNHSDISYVNSYADTLGLLTRHIHENNLKWAAAPNDSQTLSDLWNLYEMSSSDNTRQSLGLDSTFRTATVSVGIPKINSNALLSLESEILDWFAQNAPEVNVSVTGHAILFASIGKNLTNNMFIGGLVSAMIISLLIGLFLGNLKLGLLSFIPNLFPAGIVYGVWGCTVGVIDIAAAGTLSISLGIVVDDTIHILKRYSQHRKAGLSPNLSIEKTFEQVGSALMLTTLILSLGMLILTLSIFGPNQTTAIIMASIICVALVYDLIMLPHLLIRCDKWVFPTLKS